jgi:hypothetical protein
MRIFCVTSAHCRNGFHTYLARLQHLPAFFDVEMGLACPDTWLLEAKSDLLAHSVEVTSKGSAPKVPKSSLVSCGTMKPLPWKPLWIWKDGERKNSIMQKDKKFLFFFFSQTSCNIFCLLLPIHRVENADLCVYMLISHPTIHSACAIPGLR